MANEVEKCILCTQAKYRQGCSTGDECTLLLQGGGCKIETTIQSCQMAKEPFYFEFYMNFYVKQPNKFFFFFFVFLGPHLWHMEVPRLGVKSELQLLTYAIATAMQNLSHVCDLHHSSQ